MPQRWSRREVKLINYIKGDLSKQREVDEQIRKYVSIDFLFKKGTLVIRGPNGIPLEFFFLYLQLL